MKTRREFIKTVGGGVTGGLILRALPLGVGAALLTRPRRAYASPGAIFDPTKYPTATGFSADGDPNIQVTPGSVLTIADSGGTHLAFYGDLGATGAGAIEVAASFRINTAVGYVLDGGGDSGVRAGFTDGSKWFMACFVADPNVANGALRVALLLDGSFSTGIQADWSILTDCTVRRVTDAQGTTFAELTVAGQTERIEARTLPASTRAAPTLEFGCYGDVAKATAEFQSLALNTVKLVPFATFAVRDLRIRDVDTNDALRLRADFALDPDSDGIDPATEMVSLELSNGAGVFYTQTLNGFDVHGQAPRRRWSLNDAERNRTGIERFDIREDGAIILGDRHTSIPTLDYSTVDVFLAIGDDAGSAEAQLVEHPAGSGRWRLP